jgi:hypothetical protein
MRRISLIQFPYLLDRCPERDNTQSMLSPEILFTSLAKVQALILGDPPLNLERSVAVESSEARITVWQALRNLAAFRHSVPEMAGALAEMTGQEAADLLDWAETLSQVDPDVAMYHAKGRIDEYVRNVDLGLDAGKAAPLLHAMTEFLESL